MTQNMLQEIETVIAERSMLKHPFYQAWNEGVLTREMLKDYACQYYHFVKDFPRMVSAVHCNTPEFRIRESLLQNLMDEELGPENHPALWMRFANALGATTEEVENTEPLPTTTRLVQTMMKYSRDHSFQEGLGCLYAYESQIPEVSRVKIDGLKKFYGIDNEEEIKFFSVHQEADVLHSQEERDLIAGNTAPELAPKVTEAARGTATALWEFLDGVQENYVTARGVAC
ncbi:MAG: CADD family putative folate metabolism protein [Ignavibacteria bacterium]|nr:CADD family putative folate metabolism protein [Ignavibacteria bacterium]